MGSATTSALAATTAVLDRTAGVDLRVADELFAAARALGDSPQLAGALADSAASTEARAKVVADVFGRTFSPTTVSFLVAAVRQRWSSASDLIDAIEELAVRAAARAGSAYDIEGEIFQFSRTVAANPQLELALGSRLGDDSAKGSLVRSLLGGRASEATTLIVSSLVQQPRERRVRQLLSRAMDLVADQRGRTVATVVSAVPLSAAQSQRLAAALSKRYGTDVSINAVIDPTVVGGVRVQIADDVIDASVSSRLAELRQRLAG
ncbi:F0F1 ATP synthase subunit delta [Microbacterium sp. BK668]|uniref:F0F1 ATP synthase subunit delta n=1 Tax=Microbacterium sp. BK668 TaxID=2512118 RepID=UPI00105D34DC|nr:F0F1 ATP synthase subunit delta [Microbacterium sp. BK668]TDN88526.1 ATP synthase F1 subcomplex delta subunit [Microbacterium sp. BK668]